MDNKIEIYEKRLFELIDCLKKRSYKQRYKIHTYV